jgi:hypothetical protein
MSQKNNCKKTIFVITIFEMFSLLSPFIFKLSSNCYCGSFASNFIDIWALLMQVVVMIAYTNVFQMLAPPITTCSHIMDFETHLSLPMLVPRASIAIHMVQEDIYFSREFTLAFKSQMSLRSYS